MTAEPSTPELVVVGVDAAGIVLHVGNEIEAWLGWPAGDVVGRPLVELMPRRFRRRHTEGFRRFVETGNLVLVGRPLVVPIRRGDGDEEEIELTLSMPSRSDPAAVIGVVRRLADRRAPSHFRVAEELRDAMERHATLDETLQLGVQLLGEELEAELGAVWVHDPWVAQLRPLATWEAEPGTNKAYVARRTDPDFVDATPHLRAAFADGRSTWVDDLTTSEQGITAWAGERHRAASYIALTAGDESVGVIELIHPTGHDLSLDGQEALAFFGDELGRLIATRIREDMEAADRRRVELALESRGVATWGYRFPTGVMTGDDRLAELYGLPPDDHAGHFARYADLIVSEDRVRTREVARAAIERREPFQFRYRIRRPDGELRWLEGSGVPVLGVDGAIREIAGVCYDVTAEVAARQALEEQARFAALSADVGQAFVRDEPLAAKLQRTTDAIVEHLRAAFARVWTVDAGSATLVLRASSGLYTHLDGGHSRIRIGEFKIGRIAATVEPHLTNDVENDPQISNPAWAREEAMKAFAGYPLMIGDRCVGVLAMFAREELPESTLRALAAAADTVAIGVEQARTAEEVMALYGESHRNAATLEHALRDRAHVAEVLQASLVPRSLPEVPGFAVHARYRAGVEEVGGDFFDVLLVGGNRWAFLIGDICGRGSEAARLTALARHSLRLALMLGHGPAEALAALNHALLRSDNDGRFCTAVCGLFSEAPDGSALIEVGVAGHPAPLVVRSDGAVTPIDAGAPLLGVLDDATFTQTEARLEPGETIVVYTDGVIEARRDGEMFGAERLGHVLSSSSVGGAEAVVVAVLEAVTEFDASASKDDLAILAIQRDPA